MKSRTNIKELFNRVILNNVWYKLLSLVVAVMIWLIVINIADPVTTKTFNGLQVNILNQSAISSINQVYEVVEGSTIDFTVEGKASAVKNLKTSDFTAYADLSQLSPVYATQIVVKCEKNEDIEINTNNKMLRVKLENIATKNVQVTVDTIGEVTDGYYVGDYEVKPNMVTVSGGESKIKRIDSVKVSVNVDGAKKSFSDSYEPVAYDEDGKIIDSTNFTYMNNGTIIDSVKVNMTVYKTKEIPVIVNVEGTPNSEYVYNGGFEFTPQTVNIGGNGRLLKKVNSVTIPVDIDNAAGTFESNVDIDDYLPEGVRCVGTNSVVSIRVFLEKIVTKIINFSATDVNLKNLGDEYICDIKSDSTAFSITVQGTESEIAAIDSSNIGAYVDLKGAKKGECFLQIQYSENIKKLIQDSNQLIHLELREKNDVDETEGPQPTASEVPSVVPESQTTEAPADAGSTDASYAGDST